MKDVIVMGSAAIDMFINTGDRLFTQVGEIPYGSKILAENINFAEGGGGVNVATALSRLGLSVALISKVGTDYNSIHVVEALERSGVDTSLIVREEGNCDHSVILNSEGHDRILLTYKQKNDKLAASDVDFERLDARWLVLMSMVGESLNTQVKVAEHCSKAGMKIMFNPSSYLIKRHPEIVIDLTAFSTILCLNLEEARLLTGRDGVSEMGQAILEMGPAVAVITDGKNGASVVTADKAYHIKPHDVEMIEATGAGDSFGAAFLAGYIKTDDVRTALEYGATESESVIGELGAVNGLLTADEIEAKISSNPHGISEY